MSFVLSNSVNKILQQLKELMFRFSLQSALDVRTRQEKVKMKEMAEALATERSINDEIIRIREESKKADEDLDVMKRSDFFNIEQMRILSRFKARMKVVTTEKRQELSEAEKITAGKQKELIEASKARKTLEILKEKEVKRFREKISRMERRSMDEIAGNMFIKKMKSAQI
jgi:flagellar protein FliJ